MWKSGQMFPCILGQYNVGFELWQRVFRLLSWLLGLSPLLLGRGSWHVL